MPLAAVAPVLLAAARFAHSRTRGKKGRRGSGVKRRRQALTFSEMGKLTYLGSTFGRNNPIVQLAAMRAFTGRL